VATAFQYYTEGIYSMTKEINNMQNRTGLQLGGNNLELAKWIQSKLEQIIKESGTTAVCMAVVAEGELLAAACAGHRGFEESATDIQDLYNVGSVSKIYVTVAIMKLVQEKKLDLDHLVTEYLPDWQLADERYRNITVRMLLDHSSGIPGTNEHPKLDTNYGGGLFTSKYRNTPEYWRTIKLRANPGSFSCYGNDGFDLLAELVEAVTGEPYIEWLRKTITQPIGLYSVGVGHWGTENHVKVACKGKEPEYYNCFGAGAIHTTVPECAIFGYLFVDSKGVIDRSLLDTTRIIQGKSFLQKDQDARNYCLGWDSPYTRNYIPLGRGAVIKSGGTEQFVSYLLVSMEDKLSLAISATNDGRIWWLPVLEEIGGEVLKALEGDRVQSEKVVLPKVEKIKQETGGMQERGKECAEQEITEDIIQQYNGFAYGSNCAYHFVIKQSELVVERYVRGEGWKVAEDFRDFTWNGHCFVNPNGGTLEIEAVSGRIYYIRGEKAFCQKNSSYALPGKLWMQCIGKEYVPVAKNNVLGTVRLEQINEDNVLIFTTENEDYAVVPLECDPQKEGETCLISETMRDGIVFWLEDGEYLCSCLEKYQCGS